LRKALLSKKNTSVYFKGGNPCGKKHKRLFLGGGKPQRGGFLKKGGPLKEGTFGDPVGDPNCAFV